MNQTAVTQPTVTQPGMIQPAMVIVGAGKAGARAAIALREGKWDGPIILIGVETHFPYDRPPLSKAAITGEAPPQPTLLVDDSMIASLGATFVGGTAVTAIDRAAKAVVLADGRRFPYAKLLIATGARARSLPIPGAERALLLRTFEDAQRLRQAFAAGTSVAIIGGGFIGLELASSAAARGCGVTVIEAQPRVLLRGVPAAIADVVTARHAAAGVAIRCGAAIAGIDSTSVTLADGQRVVADVLVAGVGAMPDTALADAAGLAIDNGIAVDGELRTSDPDIFAAGDCCSFPHPLFGGRRLRLESWRASADQAIVAAANMLGGAAVYDAVPWFWSDQYDLTLQIAGLPVDGTADVHRPLSDGAQLIFHLDASGRLVGASGIGRGNTIARDVRLAEMLIGRRAAPDPAKLADPTESLKAMLKT